MSVTKDELIVLSDTEEMEASESKTAETDVSSPGFVSIFIDFDIFSQFYLDITFRFH